MKKIVLMAISLVVICTVQAQSKVGFNADPAPKKIVPMTIEERKLHMMKTVGGFVTKPSALPGVVYLNLQQKVAPEFICAAATKISASAKFKHSVITETSMNADGRIAELLKTRQAGLVIAVIDDPGQPSLLTAQDSGWIKLNVAFLVSDKPSLPKLEERVDKQLWRATGLAFGAGYSLQFPLSVMHPIHTLKDLDALSGRTYGTDTVQVILNSAERIGIASERPYTYKKACQEGWAPMPTNEWQKAIWEANKK